MRIYKVIVGENRFEYIFIYSNIVNEINLSEWNKIVRKIDERYPILDSNDIYLMRTIGGTVIYRDNNEDLTYLIDMDFMRSQFQPKLAATHRNTLQDPYLYDKFESFRKSIKRDMELNEVLK